MNDQKFKEIKQQELDKLKKRILDEGVSFFASRSGLSKGYVSKILNGKKAVSLEQIISLQNK